MNYHLPLLTDLQDRYLDLVLPFVNDCDAHQVYVEVQNMSVPDLHRAIDSLEEFELEAE